MRQEKYSEIKSKKNRKREIGAVRCIQTTTDHHQFDLRFEIQRMLLIVRRRRRHVSTVF